MNTSVRPSGDTDDGTSLTTVAAIAWDVALPAGSTQRTPVNVRNTRRPSGIHVAYVLPAVSRVVTRVKVERVVSWIHRSPPDTSTTIRCPSGPIRGFWYGLLVVVIGSSTP